MGRRRLLPNINSMLLRLHLPPPQPRSSTSSGTIHLEPHGNGGNAKAKDSDDSDHRTATTTSNEPKQQMRKQEEQKEEHEQQDVPVHQLHVFSWPSLRKRPSALSCSSSNDDGEEHDSTSSNENEDEEHSGAEPTSTCRHDRGGRDEPELIGSAQSPGSREPSQRKDALNRPRQRPPQPHSVSFGNCLVRIYPQVLGDHPCCLEGCPIQLGWFYTEERLFRVDDYESEQRGAVGDECQRQAPQQQLSHHDDDDEPAEPPQRPCKHKRAPHELRLTAEERRSILLHTKQRLQNGPGYGSGTGNSSREHERQEPYRSGGSCNHQPHNKCRYSTHDGRQLRHERELNRECRRLQRCNNNVKASRKRDRRSRAAFFGSTTCASTSEPPDVPTTSDNRDRNDTNTMLGIGSSDDSDHGSRVLCVPEQKARDASSNSTNKRTPSVNQGDGEDSHGSHNNNSHTNERKPTTAAIIAATWNEATVPDAYSYYTDLFAADDVEELPP